MPEVLALLAPVRGGRLAGLLCRELEVRCAGSLK